MFIFSHNTPIRQYSSHTIIPNSSKPSSVRVMDLDNTQHCVFSPHRMNVVRGTSQPSVVNAVGRCRGAFRTAGVTRQGLGQRTVHRIIGGAVEPHGVEFTLPQLAHSTLFLERRESNQYNFL